MPKSSLPTIFFTGPLFWVAFLVPLLVVTACSDMQLRIPGIAQPLFRDEFVLGQTGNWLLESDEMGSTTIVPEQLLIEVNSPNLVQFAALKSPQFEDFVLEVDGRILSGSPQSSYGILFRMQGPNQFYRFEITGDGTFTLERHDQNGTRTLFLGDWRDSSAINQGLNANNHLTVAADGPNITLFVNDVELAAVSDDAYLEGGIALDAGTFSFAPLQVAFDNLIIYPPGARR
jgi:hypothetical protein